MSNPLLTKNQLPLFEQIQLQHFKPAIEQLIAQFQQQLERSVSNSSRSFEEVVTPLSEITAHLDHVWSLFSHLKNVTDSGAIREIFDELSSMITSFYTELGQNGVLCQAYKEVEMSDPDMSPAQRSMLEKQLVGFRLNGVELEDQKKARFSEIKQMLVSLNNTFAENVLDATQAWQYHVLDEKELDGIPDAILEKLVEKAHSKGFEKGFLITLDLPCYLPVMQFAKHRELRERLYTAYMTRASDQGPMAGKHDNSDLMREILSLRKEMSELLGFSNFAELSVETKMVDSAEQVLDFLDELAEKSREIAKQELEELERFAKDELSISDMQAWDLAYVAECFRSVNYQLDQEELRPYFPLPRVLDGMFRVADQLFDVQIKEVEDVEVPHPDTRVFVLEQSGVQLAFVYMDLYARDGKRGGAWVGPSHTKSRLRDGSEFKPMAFLVCNFTSPTADQPSLLTHNEMITLFHEFGHALHHCLTEVVQPEVSGLSGVPWDAVELPSQFLENWCWQPEVLESLSGHVDSGAPLPRELIDRMISAKRFQAAMQAVRQLEFAIFDFRLHYEFDASTDIMRTLREVQNIVSVMPAPEFARFPHGFSHIFAGGYSAGYYSYKWAEVLAADAFSAFEEEGVFNPETGARFRREILAQGGARDVNEMFVAFRGRMPRPEALLSKIGVRA